jgi:hypothetical protein
MNKLVIHKESHLEEERCGFRKDTTCKDVRYTIQQSIDKMGQFSLPTILLFIDIQAV